MTDDKLMPCPFCGGEAWLEIGMHYGPFARIACNGECMAEMSESAQSEDAAKSAVLAAWNRRTHSPATAGVTDALRLRIRDAILFLENTSYATGRARDMADTHAQALASALGEALSAARMRGE